MLKVKRLSQNAYIPVRSSRGAAGYDLKTPEDITLRPGLNRVPLKISIELPPNTYGRIACRSSLASKFSVEAGVVDEDYRGEIIVLLRWHHPQRTRDVTLSYSRGHKIAQLIVTPYLTPSVTETTLSYSDRGDGGFGSTDVAVAFKPYKD
jgi:dUTP pyrophosphatase